MKVTAMHCIPWGRINCHVNGGVGVVVFIVLMRVTASRGVRVYSVTGILRTLLMSEGTLRIRGGAREGALHLS